jgi:hypothetical protein
MSISEFLKIVRPDQSTLPACLVNLTDSQKGQIDATLSNDEASTDEEILELWAQCDISEDAAKAAIAYRSEFFRNPLFQLFPYTDPC